jgi:hypothetical protein
MQALSDDGEVSDEDAEQEFSTRRANARPRHR